MPLNSLGYLENIFSPIIYSYKATQGSQLAIWEDSKTLLLSLSSSGACRSNLDFPTVLGFEL